MPAPKGKLQPIRAMESEIEFLQLNASCFIANDNNITEDWDYAGVLDIHLTALTGEERITFKIIVFVLCSLSLFGNISTLGVNFQRKMRPFFRACLISLALSDLLSTAFLTTVYFAQFSTDYVQIWVLGDLVCKVVPFVTTSAILASSITLLLIALDRYFAVMKAFVSHWRPGHISALIYMVGIWSISTGISCPLFWVYHTLEVYLLTEVDVASRNEKRSFAWRPEIDDSSERRSPYYGLAIPESIIKICISDQKDIALYYITIVSIIFIPSITAFIWLNVTIAKKIWIRRHREHSVRVDNLRPTSSDSKSALNTNSQKMNVSGGDTPTKRRKAISMREQRHIRMVVVIVFLIAIFIVLRLPAWIFLLMRMYGTFSKPHHWLIYFSFGILNLASCALNPLCYTFLHETIQFIECCTMKFGIGSCRVRRYCSGSSESSYSCACCGLLDRIFGKSKKKSNMQESTNSNEKSRGAEPQDLEKDEGVYCSDGGFADSDDEGNEKADDKDSAGESCKKDIFTVFSISLVVAQADLGVKAAE